MTPKRIYAAPKGEVGVDFHGVLTHQRDVIARGIFTSVKDLDRKLMRYIRAYNKNPKPIKWKYGDPSRRICSMPIQ